MSFKDSFVGDKFILVGLYCVKIKERGVYRGYLLWPYIIGAAVGITLLLFVGDR